MTTGQDEPRPRPPDGAQRGRHARQGPPVPEPRAAEPDGAHVVPRVPAPRSPGVWTPPPDPWGTGRHRVEPQPPGPPPWQPGGQGPPPQGFPPRTGPGPYGPPQSRLPQQGPHRPGPPAPRAPLGTPVGQLSPVVGRPGRPYGALLGVLAGVVVVMGPLLPWASATVPLIGTITVTGMDGGDGVVALAAGIALLVASGARLQPRAALALRIVAGGLGATALGVAVLDLVILGGRAAELADAGLVSIGPGLPVLIVGGVLGVASAVLPGVRRPPAG